MFSILKRWKWLVVSVLCLVGSSVTLAESTKPINDAVALNGIQEAKTVFLIDFTSPKKTALYLKTIHGTYRNYVKQGVKPKMVLVFIGETVRYLSTKPDETLVFEYESELSSIAESVKKFGELGVRMEVCAVATGFFNINNDTVLPGMEVIGDGFISLTGWQYQGYKLVPIF
ncbi:hypothetical protein AVO42_03140 [Thiomicrospira sp. XS5]|nr:hypothetical protein AVO42_03140 [Thiomicrospira sp. XS5]